MHIHAAPVERYACTPRFWTPNPCIYIAARRERICIVTRQRIEHILPSTHPFRPPPDPPGDVHRAAALLFLCGAAVRPGVGTPLNRHQPMHRFMHAARGGGNICSLMQFRTRGSCGGVGGAFSDRFVKRVRGTGPGWVGGGEDALSFFTFPTLASPFSGPAARLQPCSGLEAANQREAPSPSPRHTPPDRDFNT